MLLRVQEKKKKKRKEMKNEINWFFLYTLALTSQQQGSSVIQAGVKERGGEFLCT